MKPDFKIKLKDEFKKLTGRDATPQEETNMETDIGLLVKVVMQELEEIKAKLK